MIDLHALTVYHGTNGAPIVRMNLKRTEPNHRKENANEIAD
jgi:hypothetical protein